jgi:hypothetical protein
MLALLLNLGLLSSSVTAEADKQPLLVVTHCMKSASPDYLGVETDLWLPMHQRMIKEGKKISWALYRVLYGDRSKCDYYVVESYLGEDQLNQAHQVVDKVFSAVHPGQDMTKAMLRTESSREIVASSLWVSVDAVEIKPHKFVTVNWMLADDPEKYIALERNMWKPVHQVLADNGHRAGWGLYVLVSPAGDAHEYNFATVDFSSKIGRVPVRIAMKSAHPKKDPDTIEAQTSSVRHYVYGQTWVRIAGVGGVAASK